MGAIIYFRRYDEKGHMTTQSVAYVEDPPTAHLLLNDLGFVIDYEQGVRKHPDTGIYAIISESTIFDFLSR